MEGGYWVDVEACVGFSLCITQTWSHKTEDIKGKGYGMERFDKAIQR